MADFIVTTGFEAIPIEYQIVYQCRMDQLIETSYQYPCYQELWKHSDKTAISHPNTRTKCMSFPALY